MQARQKLENASELAGRPTVGLVILLARNRKGKIMKVIFDLSLE